MSCPRCGGTDRQIIGPGLYQCSNILYDRMPVPPDINHPFAMRYQDVAYPCGHTYREETAQTERNACPEHGLFALGMCQGCHSTARCGMCGRLKCRVCRSQEEAAEAKARRVQQAKEEAARQAKRVAHDAVVTARAKAQDWSQQQLVTELQKLDREIVAIRQKLYKKITEVRVSYVLSALVGLGFWVIAFIIVAKTPAKPVGLFPFAFGLAFLFPLISSARGAAAKSKPENLTIQRDCLLEFLGCGEDCEYGCRRY